MRPDVHGLVMHHEERACTVPVCVEVNAVPCPNELVVFVIFEQVRVVEVADIRLRDRLFAKRLYRRTCFHGVFL